MKISADSSLVDQTRIENDPLLYDLDLPLHGVYHPLGFSIEVATNSGEVLAAAQESWGDFRKTMDEPAVQLRIAVLDGERGKCSNPPTVRAQRNLLVRVADAHNFSVSNMELGFAACWLTPKVVEDTGYLRYFFLEGMSWDLLQQLYLTSIHAACVRLGNQGVLLCGDSGAGKSSLAYTCARRGWALLSDDSTCLIRNGHRAVVVGNPYQIRFRDSAVLLFPELRDLALTRRVNGKLSIEVPTANLPVVQTITESTVDHIVFLKRGQAGAARLLPLSKDQAWPWFEKVICYGEPEVREAQRVSLRKLLTHQLFELHYDSLESAASALESMVGQPGQSSEKSSTAMRQQSHA
jgi:hypothetical protein